MTNVEGKWGELELGREEKWSWARVAKKMELAGSGWKKIYRQNLFSTGCFNQPVLKSSL